MSAIIPPSRPKRRGAHAPARPAIGVQIHFDAFDAELEFLNERRLRLTFLRGPADGFMDEVDYFLTPIGADGAQLGFTESSGATFVHAIDRLAGLAHTTIVKPDGEVMRLCGRIAATPSRRT